MTQIGCLKMSKNKQTGRERRAKDTHTAGPQLHSWAPSTTPTDTWRCAVCSAATSSEVCLDSNVLASADSLRHEDHVCAWVAHTVPCNCTAFCRTPNGYSALGPGEIVPWHITRPVRWEPDTHTQLALVMRG